MEKLKNQIKNHQNSGKKVKTWAIKLKTQSLKLKTQAKNSRFQQIHLVELPKTGQN